MMIGGYDPRQTNRLSAGRGMENFAPDVQGFDPIANSVEQGFYSPELAEASIAINERQASRASTKAERAAAFRRAFASARAAGLKEFEFEGSRFNTRLKGEAAAPKAVPVPVPVPVKDPRHGEGKMLPMTKGAYDALMATATKFTTAPALNTAPVPEDVVEQGAYGRAGGDYANAWGIAAGVTGFGGAFAKSLASKAQSMGRLVEGNTNFLTRGQQNLATMMQQNARANSISSAFKTADAAEMEKVLARLYRY